MTTPSILIRYRQALIPLLFLFLLTVSAQTAGAERYMAIYQGVSHTNDTNISVTDSSGFPVQKTDHHLSFDTSGSFGLRMGRWTEIIPPLGAATDISYFEAKADEAIFKVVPLSLMLMVRVLDNQNSTSDHQKVTPYIGFGPSVVLYDMAIDLRPTISSKISEWSIDLGWDARGGISWQANDRLGLFVEYRYSHLPIDFEETSIIPVKVVTKIDSSLNTQQLLFGLSYHFE